MKNTDFNANIINASKTLKPFAMRLTHDHDDAKDLLQETLIKAYTYRDKFATGTNLKAWMYTIMKNTFITNYKKKIKKNTFIDTSNNNFYINSPHYSTKNLGISEFIVADIKKALNLLEDTFRVPFEMFYEGFKYEEIAIKLDIPLGTVKNRIHIARKELKSMLVMYK